MIRALILVDNRLASSIALKYACRLAKQTGMDLQTIYIEEPEHNDRPPGAGWVRSTWEKGLLVSAGVEISQLIDKQKPNCPTLRKPKMFLGDSQTEILRELRVGTYDLFVEGANLEFDILHVKLKKPGRLNFKKNEGGTESADVGEADEVIASAGKMLAEAGWSPQATKLISGVPAGIADYLEDYGLVAACLPRQTHGKNPMLELLSRVPSAVRMCRQ